MPTWSSCERRIYPLLGALVILGLVAIYLISRLVYTDWDEFISFVGFLVFVVWLFFYFPTIKKINNRRFFL